MKKKFETTAVRLTSNSGDMELSLVKDITRISNKNNRQMKLIYIIAGLIVFTFYSCSKGLDPKPTNLVLASVQFTTDSKANNAVVGLYSTMYSNNDYSSLSYSLNLPLYTGLSADELSSPLSGNNDQPLFINNNISVLDNTVEGFWSEGYNNIYQANAIIENVAASTGISAAGKAQFTGEAKFLRALNYFYLVNMFGGVPLVVTTDYHVTSTLPKATVAAIYQQMISDLTDAAGLLTDAYYTAGRVRANKASALALLARVYLYNSDWANADKEASAVITDPIYKLDTAYSNIFLNTSNEAIFQFYTSAGYTQYQYSAAVDVESYGTYFSYTLTPDFVKNAFAPGDKRKAAFTDSLVYNGDTIRYPYKYKNRYIGTTTEYYMCLRLSEQYLIRAEARAKEQPSNMAGAVADLNFIHTRAGLPPIAASISLDDFKIVLEKERRAELCFEWGDRWFNLKRTGRADAVLNGTPPLKPGWKSTDVLYPIPQSEIDNNPNLIQNSGY